MGSWNSDGTFGYASVPLSAVRRAAEDLMNPDVIATLSRPKHLPERTTTFLELSNTFGFPLIAAIVAAYRECSPERMGNNRAASLPANAAEPRPLVRTAAGSPDPTLSPSATRTTGARRVQWLCANSLALTHLPVPLMLVLQHLPRQEVKFSGSSDRPIASRLRVPA